MILRKNIVINFLKCLKQYLKRKLWLKIYLTTNMICEKANFMIWLSISFFLKTILKTILTIVWLISFSVIFEKLMFSKYAVLAMSSRFAATSEKKKNLIKHWVFVFLINIIILFKQRKNDVINLNDVKRFFTHLTSFTFFKRFQSRWTQRFDE